MVVTLSYLASSFDISSDTAHSALDPAAAIAAQLITPAPGFNTTSAPINPTITAPQRRKPTGSPNQNAAPIVTNMAVRKLNAPASASGIWPRA